MHFSPVSSPSILPSPHVPPSMSFPQMWAAQFHPTVTQGFCRFKYYKFGYPKGGNKIFYRIVYQAFQGPHEMKKPRKIFKCVFEPKNKVMIFWNGTRLSLVVVNIASEERGRRYLIVMLWIIWCRQRVSPNRRHIYMYQTTQIHSLIFVAVRTLCGHVWFLGIYRYKCDKKYTFCSVWVSNLAPQIWGKQNMKLNESQDWTLHKGRNRDVVKLM